MPGGATCSRADAVTHAAVVLEPALTVTVWAGRRRLDVDLPAHVPLAELLPPLADRLGVIDTAALAGARLLVASGDALDPGLGLAEQGVRQGEVLELVVGTLRLPNLYDDPAAAIAAVAAAPPLRPVVLGSTQLGAAGLGLLTTWFELLGWAGPPGLLAPTSLALVLLAAGALLATLWPAAALLMACSAGGFAGLAGSRVDHEASWLGAGLAIVLAGLLAGLALDEGRRWLLPLLAVGASAAVLGAVDLGGLDRAAVASIGLVLAAAAPPLLPRVATSLAVPDDAGLDCDTARTLARSARGLVDALTAALAAVVLVLVLVLGVREAAVPLTAVCGLLLLLRAKGSEVRVVLGVLGGSACLLVAASRLPGQVPAITAALTLVTIALATGTQKAGWSATAQLANDRLERAALMSLPVCGFLAAGGFAWLERAA